MDKKPLSEETARELVQSTYAFAHAVGKLIESLEETTTSIRRLNDSNRSMETQIARTGLTMKGLGEDIKNVMGVFGKMS